MLAGEWSSEETVAGRVVQLSLSGQHRYREAEEQMAKWIQSGQMKRKETVLYGIEKCVEGLQGLFKGAVSTYS